MLKMCVSLLIPDFGVSTAIMLFRRCCKVNFGPIQTASVLSNILACNNFKLKEKRITFDIEIKVFKIYSG